MCSDIKFIGTLCRTKHGLLIPKEAVQVLQDVMEEGQIKHGDAWKKRTEGYYTERAMEHMKAWQELDISEDHLTHAFADLALAVALRDKEK